MVFWYILSVVSIQNISSLSKLFCFSEWKPYVLVTNDFKARNIITKITFQQTLVDPWSLRSTKGSKEKEDKEKTTKEKKEKKEKNPGSTPEAKAGGKDKQKEERSKEEKPIDSKEKTPKAEKDKRKDDKKEEKSKIDGKSAEKEWSKERDVSNDSKTKEGSKVEKNAGSGSLKSPVPRSEGVESERGKRPWPWRWSLKYASLHFFDFVWTLRIVHKSRDAWYYQTDIRIGR